MTHREYHPDIKEINRTILLESRTVDPNSLLAFSSQLPFACLQILCLYILARQIRDPGAVVWLRLLLFHRKDSVAVSLPIGETTCHLLKDMGIPSPSDCRWILLKEPLQR